MAELSFTRFIRRLTTLWVLSLIGIGLLALTSSVLFNDAVSQSESFADIVNLAGRQRTLSQQIALYAGQYAEAESESVRLMHAEHLRETVDTMRAEFDLLDEYTTRIPALIALYYENEPAIDASNRAYWDAADALLAISESGELTHVDPYLEIKQNAETILTLAEQGVDAVFDESIASASRLRQLNTMRLTFVIILLAAQFAFAFRPAVERLRQKALQLEHEIGERKRAETELRASEQRFRSVVETAPVGIFRTDLQGAITWVNPYWERLMGIRGDDVNGLAWMDAIHAEDRPTVVAEAERTAVSGLPLMVDFRLAKRDGLLTILHSTVIPTVDDNGAVTGYLGMSMDITQRKLADQQALKLESERQRVRVLGEFIRDTSHDLRTPLSVIKSGLYLAGRLKDVDRIHQKLTVIDEHVTYLTVVIDQLQEMAILDTLTDLTLTSMNVTPLLRDMMGDFSQQADAQGKIMRFEFDADLPKALISPEKLMQAVRVVLNNALRFTQAGGQITLKAARAGKGMEISVSDDGAGIAPEHLARVFERFYKADKARAMGGGAGLGLSIAKRVIELHGGKISLESRPGEGTTVRMSLIVPLDPNAEFHTGA